MKRRKMLLLGVMAIGAPPLLAQTADSKPSDLVGLWKGDVFVQQAYVYKVTLVDQQLSFIEVDYKLQRAGGLSASGHEWLQEATFKRR